MANELAIVPAPVKERVFLSCEEMKPLISSITEPTARLIVTTLFYTGMRISECLGLKPEDVDLVSGIINVRNTKNRVERNIPIHRKLKPLLKEYSMQFASCGGRRGSGHSSRKYFFWRGGRSISADYVNRVLRETTRKLKWSKKVTCHIIRHSFASSLVQKNINLVNIQKLLGHNSLSTTSIYTHTNMKNLQNVINTIDNAI
jgi:integrase/recombinase XerD